MNVHATDLFSRTIYSIPVYNLVSFLAIESYLFATGVKICKGKLAECFAFPTYVSIFILQLLKQIDSLFLRVKSAIFV